jgi:hypothetical protein
MLSFFAFIIVHVTLIMMTGFARNMNHIVLGTDDQGHLGMYLGFVGLAACGEITFSGVTELVSEIAMISRPSES